MAKKGDWVAEEFPNRREICWFRLQDKSTAEKVADFLSQEYGYNYFVETTAQIFAVVVTYTKELP